MSSFKMCYKHDHEYIYVCPACVATQFDDPLEEYCGNCGQATTDLVWDACPDCFGLLYPWSGTPRKHQAQPRVPSFETEATTHPRKTAA